MTVVTDFSLYSETAVIFVTAVISYKLYESAFACAFCSVLNAHRLQHLAGKLTEIFAYYIGRDFCFSHLGK